MNESNPLLQIKDLKTYFFLDEGTVKAVDGADLELGTCSTLGVVGESGCGKSVAARSIMQIVAKGGRIVSGEILFHHQLCKPGTDRRLSEKEEVIDLAMLDPQGDKIRSIRGAEISMVFQEPMTSLSPVHTIGNQIGEVISLHQKLDPKQAREKAIAMLDHVGMPLPKRTIDRYPHELSGGMRQRAMIAMALSCHPSLLIADEPTTALDVTTEAQILSLMRKLQDELGMSIMFITHNLGVIAQMADRVAVMYLGKVVEAASVDTLFYKPLHPYTQALMESIPRLGAKKRRGERLASIRGSVPDPYNLPKGCPFHPRCAKRVPNVCDREEPPNLKVDQGHEVRCVLYK
ncbi:MAG: ABC transporter ATP-binding protein [Anaerolineales bacterium]|nr:ABC transporter ATP-binding protein [Anaerolineales bacterium]